jgi:WD40 repeat protein/flagellar biosynthesis GTPase FlhF
VKLDSPYKGLDAFDDSDIDVLLFFGREREREIVVANLIASRLTVLYGPTGVGKSSLLRAGVAPSLRRLPEAPLVVVFDRWSDDPAADLAALVAEANGERSGALVETVEAAQHSRDVYLILDQAEEHFVYQGTDDLFDSELARLVGGRLRVNILLSLREDSLAKLDRFKPRIPAVYANSLRLDRLDRGAGRAAIVNPVERWNSLQGERVGVDDALVSAVLDGVEAGRIERGVGGLGVVETNGRAAIEAPYLQLVMQRLWEVERSGGSSQLRAETLAGLGGARRVVADHLERAVGALTASEQDVASQLFTFLVTPSGTKIAHNLSDLAEYAGVAEADARPVVDTLTQHRILRPDESGRTEIFHDVLAGEVLAWRRAHGAERALAVERASGRRKQRRALAFAAAAAVVATAMAAVTVFALSQRSEAQEQAASAQAAREQAEAQAELAHRQSNEAKRQKAEADRQKANAEQANEEAQAQADNATNAQQQAETNQKLAQESAAEARDAQQKSQKSAEEATEAQQHALKDAVIARRQKAKAVEAEAKANTAANEAHARALAETANALLQIRPLQSLRLSTQAARLEPDSRLAERVLRAALAASCVREVLPGGGGPLADASFSPDGRLVLTVARRARIFDGRTGRLLRTLSDPSSVTAAAFSPDGRLVATADSDGTARLWEVGGTSAGLRSPEPAVLRGHRRAIESVSFSRDGRLLVTASDDGKAIVWRTDTGEQVSSLRHDGPVKRAVFDPSGRVVVTVSHVGQPARFLARLFDATSGKALVTFDQRGVRSAIFSPEGSVVVTTSNDNTARVWDPNTGKTIAVLTQDEDVVSAAFSPDGRKLVTATEGGSTFIWDVATWRREFFLVGPLNPLTGASFSPDGRFVVVSSRDRTARLYRSDNGMQVTTLAGHQESVVAASYGPNGRSVVTASEDGTARLWDPGTENLLELVGRQNDGAIRRASFSPDGRLAVSASADGTARILEVARKRELEVLRHGAGVNDAEFSPSGKLVVTASDDETARIWQVDGRLLRVLPHGGPVLRAVFSPDGRLVATASRDGLVRIWSVSGDKLPLVLRGHKDAVLDVAFSPDGKLVASAGDNGDRTARIWRIDGRQVHVLRHRGPVVRVSFSPDGRLVLTASGDEMARLWKVGDGRLLHLLKGHTDYVRDAEFSHDGKFVVTASDDHDGRIWSVATGKTLSILRGHLRGPQTASFSRDGRWVVTSGGIAAGLWDTSTGRFFAPTGLAADPFLRGHASGPLASAVFDPDSRRVLTAGADGTVRTYLCELCGGTRALIRVSRARQEALENGLTPAERRRYLRG